MLKVHILSSKLVPPKHMPSKDLVIASCNLDLVILNVYIKTVYFYSPLNGKDLNDFFSPNILTSSLANALSIYYPVAGRLVRKGDRHIEIKCNGAGALFVYAHANCSFDDLGTFKPKPEFMRLVPSLNPELEECSQPLFIVQVTRFTCGGVALGIGVEHHLADGLSAISFLNAWATIARGEAIKNYPSFDKAWLQARSPPMPQFPHHEYISLPPKPMKNVPKPSPNIQIFDFSEQFVQNIKESRSNPRGGSFSTFELLAAHIWRCVCKARDLPSKETTMLVTLIDGRSRLIDPCSSPKNFFGNVIFTSCPTGEIGTIATQDLACTAKVVQQALRRMDNDYCRSAIDFLEVQFDLAKFIKGEHTFSSPNLGLISWSQLPMYETDFGWGKPIYVGPASMPWEGHAYLLRSPSSHKAFRLFISLNNEHMPKFEELILQLNH